MGVLTQHTTFILTFYEGGTSTPHFSLRDEVLNTERHHSDWSSSVKLRHMAISFVSAGYSQPLDEVKTDRAALDAITSETKPSVTLGEEQAQPEDAIAQLQIRTPPPSSPVAENMGVHKGASEATSEAMDTTGPSQSQPLFVVDSVGDQALKPVVTATVPVPIRSAARSPSDSEDEVILFRGRRDPVVIKDESFAGTPSTEAPVRDALAKPAPGTKSIQQTSPPASTREPKRKARPTRRGRRAKTSDAAKGGPSAYPDDDDDDIDDEVLKDYLENVDCEDLLTAFSHPEITAEDEWVSSEMDDSGDLDDSDGLGEFFQDGPDGMLGQMDALALAQLSGKSNMALDFAIDDMLAGYDMEADDFEGGDEDGTSDPGDDSDLESELEYTERQRWEDEADLRQRQADAMTDEEIARILAKQEDLGMGSEELMLFDDSGFGDVSRAQTGLDAILADPGHRNHRKNKKGRRQGHFPEASLMADVLEQDPYGGFDVMDFDRPSLRNTGVGRKGRKSNGPLPEELADLSDSDMADNLQSAWANDRTKKAAKKAEREELRAQGLLGRKNKFKPDLGIKFSQGMSLDDVRSELETFLADPTMASKAFPPMEKGERKLLHEIALLFDLTSNSRGSGRNRFTIISKRARTPTVFDEVRWSRALRLANRGFLRGAGKGRGGVNTPNRAGRGGGFSAAAVGYMDGEVVGAAAPEIADSSFGHKLMLKMGWEKGMALGKGGEGLLVPVQAKVKSGRGGLG